MKKSIIIPAYNEAEGISEVVKRCKKICKKGDEVIVVDDGSADDTVKLAKKSGARVIKHKQNMGKAFALKTGFKAAKNDVLVTIDGDCTYPPEAIPAMISALKDHDLVVGSRFMNGLPKDLPLHRGLANFYGALFTSCVLGKRVTDVTTGLRAFKKETVNGIPIKATGLDFEAEFTSRAISKGYSYREVPIVAEEREGQSTLRFFKHMYLFTRAVLRGRFRG